MRWYIAENKRKIETEDMSEHFGDIDMSGEKVLGIIHYGARDGKIETVIDLVFPSLRVQPNNTYGSYTLKGVKSPQLFMEQERFVRAEIDGVLTLYSRIKAGDIICRFYPSETESVFYEEIDIIAREEVVPVWEFSKRLETKIGCEGYIYVECKANGAPCKLAPGEKETVLFSYSVRYNEEKLGRRQNLWKSVTLG